MNLEKYRQENYLDSKWDAFVDIVWYKFCPRFIHTIVNKITDIYYHHKTAIINYYKYGAYFPSSDLWSLCDATNDFLLPRLRAFRDRAGNTFTPCIGKEAVELSGLPKTWFINNHGHTVFKKGKWIKVLNIIIDGLDSVNKENILWGKEMSKMETKAFDKKMAKIQEDRKQAMRLLTVFYDNLWY